MDINWYLPAEVLVQQIIFWSRRQVLAPAHDMGYLHQMVVNYICEIIGGKPIGLDQHLVFEHAVFNCYGAINGVFKGSRPSLGHFLPYDISLSPGKPVFNLVLA